MPLMGAKFSGVRPACIEQSWIIGICPAIFNLYHAALFQVEKSIEVCILFQQVHTSVDISTAIYDRSML